MYLVMGIGHRVGVNMTQAAAWREGAGVQDDRRGEVFTKNMEEPSNTTTPNTHAHMHTHTHTPGINMIFLSFL